MRGHTIVKFIVLKLFKLTRTQEGVKLQNRHILNLDGYNEITVSLNIRAMNSKSTSHNNHKTTDNFKHLSSFSDDL